MKAKEMTYAEFQYKTALRTLRSFKDAPDEESPYVIKALKDTTEAGILENVFKTWNSLNEKQRFGDKWWQFQQYRAFSSGKTRLGQMIRSHRVIYFIPF